MRFFWNARMNHWRVYGVWINNKYFVGFSITVEPVSLTEKVTKIFKEKNNAKD